MSGGAGDVQAKFLFEGGKEFSTGIFKNKEQVQRKVDILNRDHLFQLLEKWLLQRSHAMGNSRNREYPLYLLNLVNGYRLVSFIEFIKVIRLYREDFQKCIPGASSPTFKHYENEIKPWLNFCLGLKNGG